MTTTTDITSVLVALEADATDALAWAKLSDWLEEARPGWFVECEKCRGAGGGNVSMMDGYGGDYKDVWGTCSACKGNGRVWVPNECIARCREMPTLLANAYPDPPWDGQQMWGWCCQKVPGASKDGKYVIPPWLFRFLSERADWWLADTAGECVATRHGRNFGKLKDSTPPALAFRDGPGIIGTSANRLDNRRRCAWKTGRES